MTTDTQEIHAQESLPTSHNGQKNGGLFAVFFRIVEVTGYICCYTALFAFKVGWAKLSRRRRSWQMILGETIPDLCGALGATYIKIGQILSTRVDLLPQEVIAPLARLQDHIPPFAFQYVPAIIKAQIRCAMDDVFVEFEQQPISSASIACVYRARLHDGQMVAVKIRRPDIVRKVRDDLRIMRFIAHVLARLPAMRLIPIVDMVEELGQLIEQQLDLRIEAQNTLNFRELFEPYPDVHIPELYKAWCTEEMLVMNFFEELVRIDELDWEEAEFHAALKTGLRALYRMIFLNGAFHCDLHPGNMYLRKGGQVVILDAGFIAHLQHEDRYQFADFFLGIATNAGKKCAHIIYETAQVRPPVFDQEGFECEVVDLISQNAGSRAATFQVAPFAYHIFDIQRRFGLRGSNSFTMAILALLVFEGTAKQWYPQLKFQAEAQPFLLQALAQKRAAALALQGKG